MERTGRNRRPTSYFLFPTSGSIAESVGSGGCRGKYGGGFAATGCMSFSRHDEIYRPDGEMKTMVSLGPCTASRWSVPSQKGAALTPRPSHRPRCVSGRLYPWRVALQQSLPPLHRQESMVYLPAETVNHPLKRAGESSTGSLGNFQPALTPPSSYRGRVQRAENAMEYPSRCSTIRSSLRLPGPGLVPADRASC